MILHGEVMDFLSRFTVFESQAQPLAIALWVMHTHLFVCGEVDDQPFDQTPYLLVTSGSIECGKSELLEQIAAMTPRSWPMTQLPSKSNLARKVEQDRPTIFVDELDKINGDGAREVLGCINSGNRKTGMIAIQIPDGNGGWKNEDFSTFCPKALAGIRATRLDDAVTSRAIIIELRKHTNRPEKWKLRRAKEVEDLRDRLDEWAEKHRRAIVSLYDAEPDMPSELTGRQEDGWEPLAAIADHIGIGDKARSAAIELASVSAEARLDDAGVQLLHDLYEIIEGRERVHTAGILMELNSSHRRWASWNNGKGMNEYELARLLRGFGIHSDKNALTIDGVSRRGYRLQPFMEVWEAYGVPGGVASVASVASVTAGDLAHALANGSVPTDTTQTTETTHRGTPPSEGQETSDQSDW